MNGRIERTDGILEVYSERNYDAVDFFFSEVKREKWRLRRDCVRRIAKRVNNSKLFWALVVFGYLWFVIWGGARGL